ncbi:MAG: sugar phosphate nucleotidyltransferase, partial [bacterium]|nr:sugar phosphate nucleotidyltransferase [bacterium]
DTPFITEKTIRKLLEIHKENGNWCTFLTAIFEEPKGYGRILRNGKKEVIGIIEEINATDEQRKIKEINAGVYVFKSEGLFDSLKKINPDPIKKEYYLTDIIKIYSQENKKISTYTTPDPYETIGINTLNELKKAEEYLVKRGKNG